MGVEDVAKNAEFLANRRLEEIAKTVSPKLEIEQERKLTAFGALETAIELLKQYQEEMQKLMEAVAECEYLSRKHQLKNPLGTTTRDLMNSISTERIHQFRITLHEVGAFRLNIPGLWDERLREVAELEGERRRELESKKLERRKQLLEQCGIEPRSYGDVEPAILEKVEQQLEQEFS